MPDDDPTAGDVVSGGRTGSSSTQTKHFTNYSLNDWKEYWSSEDGKNYLEDMRGLVSTLFKWGYPVEEYEICLHMKDSLRSAALTELVELGELEVVTTRSFGVSFGISRNFVRRKLS